MKTSIVKVYNSQYGKWESNVKVRLSWSGFVNLGMSSPVYTDRNGTAIIEHSATGQATVFVNGREVGRMQTPGDWTVRI